MKILLRIILSPFVAIWGALLLAAGTIFPLPLMVGMAFIGIITFPFIYLLKLSGADVKYFEAFSTDNDDESYIIFAGYLVDFTIYLWAIPAVVFMYIKTGKVFTGN